MYIYIYVYIYIPMYIYIYRYIYRVKTNLDPKRNCSGWCFAPMVFIEKFAPKCEAKEVGPKCL